MDTKKIAAIIESAKSGSYNKAAEQLGYSPSALGYIVKTVEEELGIKLLAKNYRGVTYTEAGLEIAPFLTALLECEKKINEKASEIAKRSNQSIRIAAFPSVANHFLPQVIQQFKNEWPDIKLELQIVDGNTVSQSISKGLTDIGFTDSFHKDQLDWIPLHQDEMYAAVPDKWFNSSSTVLSMAEFKSFPVLLSEYSRSVFQDILNLTDIPNYMLASANNGYSILSMVQREMGVTLVTQMNRLNCPPGVRLLPLNPPIYRTLGICIRDYQNLNPTIKDFISACKVAQWP